MKFLYGDAANIQPDCVVINFNSLIEGFPSANLLPPNNLGAISEYDFDVKYMNWILCNDTNFINFMNIIMEIYYGRNIYLIINKDEWGTVLIESLLKLIQQRYGINATFINSPEDIYYAPDSEFNSYYGINNFDQDKERYVYLYEQIKVMQNGGNVYVEDYEQCLEYYGRE